MGVLSRTPQVDNWIDRLPSALQAAFNKTIIYRAAIHMVSEHGMAVGHAIASAINWARHIVRTGDIKQWPGPQQVNPGSVAECAAALAVWDEMRAYARSHKAKTLLK